MECFQWVNGSEIFKVRNGRGEMEKGGKTKRGLPDGRGNGVECRIGKDDIKDRLHRFGQEVMLVGQCLLRADFRGIYLKAEIVVVDDFTDLLTDARDQPLTGDFPCECQSSLIRQGSVMESHSGMENEKEEKGGKVTSICTGNF